MPGIYMGIWRHVSDIVEVIIVKVLSVVVSAHEIISQPWPWRTFVVFASSKDNEF